MNKIYVRFQEVDEEIIALNGIKINNPETLFSSVMFDVETKNIASVKINDDYGYLLRDLTKIRTAVDEITDANDKINPIISSRNKAKIKSINKELKKLVDVNKKMLEIIRIWNFLSLKHNDLLDFLEVVKSNINKINKKMLFNDTDNISNFVIKNQLDYYTKEKSATLDMIKTNETSFTDKINIVRLNMEVFNNHLSNINEMYNSLVNTYNKELRSTIHKNKTALDDFEKPSDYILKSEINQQIAILGYIDSGNEDDKQFWLSVSDGLYSESIISKDDYNSLIDKINKSSFQFAHIILQKLMNYGFEKIAYYIDIKDFFKDKNSYKVVSIY